MRIAIFATNEPNIYSGGRYASLMMAEALALAGHDTYYATNNRPLFYDDLSVLPGHKSLSLHLTRDFVSDLPRGEFDIVVLVPYVPFRNRNNTGFFTAVRSFARERAAKLVLLNFETPNWFNTLSPAPVDDTLWDSWKACCEDGCLVLSLSMEGMKYARRFYTDYPDITEFDYCYPSINSVAADSVHEQTKEKRTVVITSFDHRQKGGSDVLDVICPAIKGHTLIFLIGKGHVPEEIRTEAETRAVKVGAAVEFKHRISDEEKFREIKRATLMLFLSHFEGFGYPPVEAQYCNVPCITFDLPVLREISGDGIHCVPRGNVDLLKSRIAELLNGTPPVLTNLRKRIGDIARIDGFAERIDGVMRNYVEKTALVQIGGRL